MNGLMDFNENLYLKKSVKGVWIKGTEMELLSSLREETKKFSDQQKSELPVFGFNRLEGERSNKQQYPTHYVICELDTPSYFKHKINGGCKETFDRMQGQFWVMFNQFKYDVTIPYYWMYLTPSTCGIRFILKTDIPIKNKTEYENAILRFLSILFLKTNGKVNPEYFDIRIDQAWFVPTFASYLDRKEDTFSFTPIKRKDKLNTTLTEPMQSYSCMDTTMDSRYQKASQFTQRNFTYQEGQRNKYIYNLACNCNRFGISELDALQIIIQQYDLGENEIKLTVSSAYKQKNEFRKFLK